jgi:hypothetical protein
MLTDKTTIKTTLGGALAAAVLIAGLHPWAIAQVRGVVAEENKITDLQRNLVLQQSFEALRGDIRELKVEVRSLRLQIERRSGR